MTDDVYQAQSSPENKPYPGSYPNQPQPWENRSEYRGRGGSSGLVVGIVVACCLGFFTIAGIFIALMLPAVQAAREAARRMQCTNHMKQITLALHTYHDVHGSLPPAYTVDAQGNPLHSWRVLLLPYVEAQSLYESIHLDEPWDSPHNSQFHHIMPSVYGCPSDSELARGEGMTTYKWIVGPDAISSGPDVKTFGQITRGLSNTLYLVESPRPVCWMDPQGNVSQEELALGILDYRTWSQNPEINALGSRHTGGINVGILDGTVQFLSQTIDTDTLQNMAKIHETSPTEGIIIEGIPFERVDIEEVLIEDIPDGEVSIETTDDEMPVEEEVPPEPVPGEETW